MQQLEDALVNWSLKVYKAAGKEETEAREGIVVDAEVCHLLVTLQIKLGKAPTTGPVATAAKWAALEDQEGVADAMILRIRTPTRRCWMLLTLMTFQIRMYRKVGRQRGGAAEGELVPSTTVLATVS